MSRFHDLSNKCASERLTLDAPQLDNTIAQYRQRVYNSVSLWQRMYYVILGNAYEGAINLNLDRSGRPKDTLPSLAS